MTFRCLTEEHDNNVPKEIHGHVPSVPRRPCFRIKSRAASCLTPETCLKAVPVEEEGRAGPAFWGSHCVPRAHFDK